MANQQITTYEPKKYHTDGNLNTHKSLPVVKWIGNGSGSSSYEVINQTLIPTRGNTSSDRPFEAKNTSLFNMSKIPSDIYSYREENGFEFNKTSTTSECAINVAVKHTGTNGMVIPATLIRSVGVEFRRNQTANANWRVWNIGLEFKHYADTSGMFAELYTPGWANGKVSEQGYAHHIFNGASHFNSIRSLGPDYVLSRIIYNLRSNGTSGAQAPSAKLYHVKIGWDSGYNDNHRIIKPANQSWDDYANDRKNGQRKFKG